MLVQGQVGNLGPFADGAAIIPRVDRQGALNVSEVHGRYYEQTFRGNMFSINGGLTTTTAAGAATFTGLMVVNPANSGFNLALNKVYISQGAALTAETELGIMWGINTVAATPLTTIRNRFAGGRASAMVASAGESLATTFTAFFVIAGSGSGAITVPGVIPICWADFEGSLVIPPGWSLCSYTSRVTTTALVFAFMWEEVPV